MDIKSPLSEPQRQQLDGIIGRMVDAGEPEENIQTVVQDFKQRYGTKPTPESPSALSTFIRPFVNVGSSLANLPGAAYRAIANDVTLLSQLPRISPVEFAMDIETDPSRMQQMLREASPVERNTIKGWGEAFKEMAPTAATAIMGGMAGGPAGMVALPAIEKYLRSRIEGETIPQAYEKGATVAAGGLLGAEVPNVARWAYRAPGRYLSLPAERHATGAGMMENIPERFGVTPEGVDAAYARAGELARQPVKMPTQAPTAAATTRPPLDPRLIEDGVSRLVGRGMNPSRAGEAILKNYIAQGRTVDEVLPAVNKSIAGATAGRGQAITPERAIELARTTPQAKPLPGPPVSVGRPPAANARLTNFEVRLGDIRTSLTANPLASLRDKPLLKSVENALADAKSFKQLGIPPSQLDGLVKAVNVKIRQATDAPTKGAWKHVLGGLHEDLTEAAARTGDPAFTAYADAIHAARLNFLREDLSDVIRLAAGRLQRTGETGITSPGKVLNWMNDNPEWVAAVEKARPGLVGSIQRDIQEIIPISNIRSASIPGAMAGSARPVLGAATGGYLAHLLGLSPQTGAELGAIFGGGGWLMEHMGAFRMSPEYIRSSFQPVAGAPSVVGAAIGEAAPTLADYLKRRR